MGGGGVVGVARVLASGWVIIFMIQIFYKKAELRNSLLCRFVINNVFFQKKIVIQLCVSISFPIFAMET